MSEAVELEPCGGCGETNPDKRCLGCLHPFRGGTPALNHGEGEPVAWPEREAVARIIDPEAMTTLEDLVGDYRRQFSDWPDERVREVAQFAYDSGAGLAGRREDALAKADAILALSPSDGAGQVGEEG